MAKRERHYARLGNFAGQKSVPVKDRERIPAEQLEPGTTYVFATQYVAGEGWHNVRVHPFGWMILGGDGTDPLEEPQVGELRVARTAS